MPSHATLPNLCARPARIPFNRSVPWLALELTVSLPKFVAPGKIVLMAPGSMTHHSDMHARYVELTVEGSGVNVQSSTATIICTMPTESLAPRGYYMVFALTDIGVPSVAGWIQIVQ